MTSSAQLQSVDLVSVQGRTLRILFVTQIISGVGVGIGASVGALLAAELGGVNVSGLAQSSSVVGSALLALPATAIVNRRGRRPSLALTYLVAALGAIVVVAAALNRTVSFLLVGFFLFGGATAAGFQARYAAIDLSPVGSRSRHLSIIVWATTIGAIAGPNLAPVAGALLEDYGLPTLAGPFLFSAVLFLFTSLTLLLLMRPDPAVVARQVAASPGESRSPRDHGGLRAALRVVASVPAARLGVTAMAVGHVVMVGVMAMTPVHVRAAGHEAAHTLRIVGVILSFHIAGMYALSPVIGWFADRLGRRPVIFAGIVLLLAACALAGTAGQHTTRLAMALVVLGIGWSSTMVAGSTLLTESISVKLRTSAQGLSDALMGLAGASAAALSGVIMHASGFPTLALVAALATTPLILLAARRVRS